MIKMSEDKFMKASITLLFAYGLFNITNFFYHFFSARLLGPSQYSIVATLFSLVYLASIGSGAIQSTAAKFTAEFKMKNKNKIAFFFQRSFRKISLYSLAALVFYILISPLIATFLKIPLSSTLILGLAVIPLMLLPLSRGILQGLQRFGALGANTIIEGIVKLGLALFFINLGFGASGTIAAVALSMVVALLLVFPLLKFRKSEKYSKTKIALNKKELYRFSMLAFVALFLLTALYNIDIFLVKHFFSAEQAGYYAVLSLLGKIIFFGATSFGAVMFPKVVEFETQNKNSKALFKKTIIFTFVVSLLILLIYWLLPRQIISAVFGPAYLNIANLLARFGFFMMLLSLAYICVLHNLAKGKSKFIWILVMAVAAEILLITLFHASLTEIVNILIALSALTLVLLSR